MNHVNLDDQEPSGQWTEQKNARRSHLIDKEIDDLLTPDEAVGPRQLQDEMLRYQNKVAPWPIQVTRKLHQELLEKAAKAQPEDAGATLPVSESGELLKPVTLNPAAYSFRQGWKEALSGQTLPIDRLWEGMDVE